MSRKRDASTLEPRLVETAPRKRRAPASDLHHPGMVAHQPAPTGIFTYDGLNLGPNDFRLLRILPTLRDGMVQCEMIVRDTCGVEFNALSYEWGPESTQRHEIILNGKVFAVRKNLSDFLTVAREKATTEHQFQQYLWIDAICINQDDLQERGHQVQKMGQLYRTAVNVFVWLGCTIIDNIENLIHVLSGLEVDEKKKFQNALPDEFWVMKSSFRLSYLLGEERMWWLKAGSCLRQLLAISYWKRMWIVPEFILANDITLMLGSYLIPFQAMCWVLESLEESSYGIWYWKRNWKNTSVDSLVRLVCDLGRGECAEEVDKVYALVSLLPSHHSFTVDYTTTMEELICKVVIYDLISHELAVFGRERSFTRWLGHLGLTMFRLGLSFHSLYKHLMHSQSAHSHCTANTVIKIHMDKDFISWGDYGTITINGSNDGIIRHARLALHYAPMNGVTSESQSRLLRMSYTGFGRKFIDEFECSVQPSMGSDGKYLHVPLICIIGMAHLVDNTKNLWLRGDDNRIHEEDREYFQRFLALNDQ